MKKGELGRLRPPLGLLPVQPATTAINQQPVRPQDVWSWGTPCEGAAFRFEAKAMLQATLLPPPGAPPAQRNGRRCLSEPPRSSRHRSAEVKPVWQCLADKGWTEYDPRETALLETSWQIGNTEVPLSWGGNVGWEVNLEKFMQLNVATQKERPVRRLLQTNSGEAGH